MINFYSILDPSSSIIVNRRRRIGEIKWQLEDNEWIEERGNAKKFGDRKYSIKAKRWINENAIYNGSKMREIFKIHNREISICILYNLSKRDKRNQ